MASNKYLELLEFSDADLANELQQSELQYQKMRFDHTIKGLENPKVLRELRRDIARINTEVRRREMATMTAAEKAGRSKIRARRRIGK